MACVYLISCPLLYHYETMLRSTARTLHDMYFHIAENLSPRRLDSPYADHFSLFALNIVEKRENCFSYFPIN